MSQNQAGLPSTRRAFLGAMATTVGVSAAQRQRKTKTCLVIHGGAGTILREELTPALERDYHSTLQAALRAGHAILARGGPSLDAVEQAIRLLEDSPLFNAGKGAVFNAKGEHELDASIMDGSSMRAGAVAGARGIRNPILAARAVMEQSPHVMLIAGGAEEFARAQGIQFAPPEYFYEERRWKQLEKAREKEQAMLDHTPLEASEEKFGTVGAVALDARGNLAAGTSTGGMTNKKFGRVGDSPIIGAGTFAENISCAVSCTGHGEYFIRAVAAYDIAALMKYKGRSVRRAAEEVIKKIGKSGGTGGAIALDARGNIAMPFNTSGMYRGYLRSGGEPRTFIFGVAGA